MRPSFLIMKQMRLATLSSRLRTAAIATTIAIGSALFTLTPAYRTVPVATSASTDMFLKIEGIDGESSDSGHRGEIDIQSWSWGVSNAGSMSAGSGGGAGKASFSDLSITKRIDKASPLLMTACATGQHIPKATLTVRRAGKNGDDYMRYTLEDVTCTSVQDSGSSDTLPTESLSLNYTKIQFEYLEERATQWTRFGWDLAKGTKI